MKKEDARGHASWRELLAEPAGAAHILHFYDSDAFLAGAVAHFAAEGLRRGEAVILSGTTAHLELIRRALSGLTLEADAAATNGQVLYARAEELVPAVLAGGELDRARFEAVTGQALQQARGEGRYEGVRWWGEMSAYMRELGHERAAMQAERISDGAAKKQGVRILCSYQCDRFDAREYDRMGELCGGHSHVIPTEDYVRHRIAVNRAIDEVVGGLNGATLQSFLSWRGLACDLPSSQAVLFWLRDAMPEKFETVLARVRAIQKEAA